MEGDHPFAGEPGRLCRGSGLLLPCLRGPLGPKLTLSFLPLEGKCVARGIGDLLPLL